MAKEIQKYVPEKGIAIYQCPGMIVQETNNQYIAKIKILPEIKKDLKFNVRKNSLEVSLSRKEEQRQEHDDFFFYGTREAAFSSEIYLNKAVDIDKVKSEYKEGVLTITIPKKSKKS